MENEEISLFGFSFRLFGRREGWIELDLRAVVEKDLLRKSSFLPCAGSTPNTSIFLMNCFSITYYGFQHHVLQGITFT